MNRTIATACLLAALAGCSAPATGPEIDFAASNREHHDDMKPAPRRAYAAEPNGPDAYTPRAAPPAITTD